MIFNIYKRGQGKYTRLYSALAIVIVTGLGCLQLYRKLKANDFGLWIETMVPAGMFVALAVLILWLINKSTVADFMIAAEGEMKKVSWSSKKEITVSTFIVIIVVIFMALLLYGTDLSFEVFFNWILQG